MASSVISEASHDNEMPSSEPVIDSGNACTPPSEKITACSEEDSRIDSSSLTSANTDPTADHGDHQAGTVPDHINRSLESETRVDVAPPGVAGEDQPVKEHTREPIKAISESEAHLTSPPDANTEHSRSSKSGELSSEADSGFPPSDATEEMSRPRDESLSQNVAVAKIDLPTKMDVDQVKNMEPSQMDSKSDDCSSIEDEGGNSSNNETELEAPVLELEKTCEAVPEAPVAATTEAKFSADILQNLSSGVSSIG